ncbi:MAG: hypothetical protein JW869_03010 [Candidatus Omnitrophica bacterium]|nr:hypothetical protein [Candidatus Omnitrophota bacterium]
MELAVIGRTQILHNTIDRLNKKKHSIRTIVTTKAMPEYTSRENDFKALAHKYKASFFNTKTLNKDRIISSFRGLDLGISVNWTSVIKRRHIDCFKIGILNAHFGDLPRYRGNATPNWAIINGEKELAASIHLMEPDRLDCGRVIVQKKLAITKKTYISDIYAWAQREIPNLFLRAVSLLEKDPHYTLYYADPDSAESFRCYPRRPQDSRIDWRDPAEAIHRLIRASSRPLQGAFSFVNRRKITIWKAQLYSDRERYSALPGQVCKIGRDYFIVITGSGKLKITDWESKEKITNVRQRLN